ncbi:hypothetical protein [Salipiger abyssi]|uniref:ABC-2 type transport system permease protein n=1 Tax=Salipiger abyssi TaxID=1250539 RepID=A0A1P8UM43_9RHOB|nr:hypothetical protein [Salipiger abyssi]APZ50445.1 ABC-2 type transport system permease protein [Salipiger abyssi]
MIRRDDSPTHARSGRDAELRLRDLHERLRRGLYQADRGERADGSGADALRAAFAEARARHTRD